MFLDCVFCEVRLFNHFMYFLLPKSDCIVFKTLLHALYACWGYCIFLLQVFLKLLEPNGPFTLKTVF